MKRTKILTVLAALLLILGLAACGMSKDGKENEGSKETGIASLLAADPKTTDEASELHQKLMQQETAILSENNSLWEKVFMSADKGMAMIEDGGNYGDFLLTTIENSKDQFTDDELKLLKDGAEQIREIEGKLTVLEQKFPDLKTSLQVDIRDKNTLLRDLKGKKGFDTDVKDAIGGANYSVTIQAEESDKQKKFLNLRVVADLVTSSISGLFKKFKNEITKDKVFLIPNFIDDNLKKGDKQSIRALEIKIPKPEEVNQAVTTNIKALGKLVSDLGNKFDEVEKDKYFKSSENAQKIVSFWKKFYGNYDSKDKISKAKSDEFKKFSSDYEKLYKDLGISKSIESDEDDEMHETITFLPKRALQKMILEMLFDEHFSINEDGKFADLMGDDSDSKEDNKDASRKADSNSEGNSEGNGGNKSDDKKDGGSNGSNAPSGNASGNDLYVIPMPGLKFPDDNEE